MDGDNGNSPTGQGVLDGNLSVTDITFVDVIVKMKNDTGYSFDQSDFISGENNGTGADYSTWGSSWTRN